MTIDLDELERKLEKLRQLSTEERMRSPLLYDILKATPELIALARKGQFYDEHVLTETANHLAETAKEWKERAEVKGRAYDELVVAYDKQGERQRAAVACSNEFQKRAEAYERALREIACTPPPQDGKGGPCVHSDEAREALEDAKKE